MPEGVPPPLTRLLISAITSQNLPACSLRENIRPTDCSGSRPCNPMNQMPSQCHTALSLPPRGVKHPLMAFHPQPPCACLKLLHRRTDVVKSNPTKPWPCAQVQVSPLTHTPPPPTLPSNPLSQSFCLWYLNLPASCSHPWLNSWIHCCLSLS